MAWAPWAGCGTCCVEGPAVTSLSASGTSFRLMLASDTSASLGDQSLRACGLASATHGMIRTPVDSCAKKPAAQSKAEAAGTPAPSGCSPAHGGCVRRERAPSPGRPAESKSRRCGASVPCGNPDLELETPEGGMKRDGRQPAQPAHRHIYQPTEQPLLQTCSPSGRCHKTTPLPETTESFKNFKKINHF